MTDDRKSGEQAARTAAMHGVRSRAYRTGIDRLGLAILTGVILFAGIEMLLAVLAGEGHPVALVAIALLSGMLAGAGIVIVVAPVWLVLHRLRWTGPIAAGVTGLALGAMLAAFVTIPGTAGAGLLRAVGLCLMAAALGAGAMLAMWRIAYRPATEAERRAVTPSR